MERSKQGYEAPRCREAGESLREWRDEIVQGELLPILEQIQHISRGEQGERAVGAALKELSAEGYRAVHSFQLGGVDIDHVLVGPAGVFLIETKYRSGGGLITFRNGEGIFVGKRRKWNQAIWQAKAGADKIGATIRHHCGMTEGVWPLVVFVGKWLVADQWSSTDVRVFTPETLKSYVRDQQPVLVRHEIEMICSHLERTARSG